MAARATGCALSPVRPPLGPGQDLDLRVDSVRRQLSQQHAATAHPAPAAPYGADGAASALNDLRRVAEMTQRPSLAPPAPPPPAPASRSDLAPSRQPPQPVQPQRQSQQPQQMHQRQQLVLPYRREVGSPRRPDPNDTAPPGMPTLSDPVFNKPRPGAQYSQAVQVSRPLGYQPPPPPPAVHTSTHPLRSHARSESAGPVAPPVQPQPLTTGGEPERARKLWCPVSGSPLPPTSPRQQRPPVGSSVVLQGLRSRRDLNHQRATVVEHDGERTDGVIAETQDGERLFVSARNLQWQNDEDAPRPPVGTTVQMKQLRARPDLSGSRGSVIGHDPEDVEGMAVKLERTGETVQVRAKSVHWLDQGPQPTRGYDRSAYIDSSPQRGGGPQGPAPSSEARDSYVRRVVQSGTPAVGSPVRARGLRSRADLNAKQGTVIARTADPAGGGGAVVDFGGERVKLRSENMEW
eukprot:TRINITY_DN4770_c0_g1_i1.p1 TRINITY_DN4770_c0_g1~~TRINITY_DN4770_c0_g1_i1.p1  ORF type:complete len:482 (+),score=102.21 TRINITY_DN4770_c0_g1_i1:59-1447(+)